MRARARIDLILVLSGMLLLGLSEGRDDKGFLGAGENANEEENQDDCKNDDDNSLPVELVYENVKISRGRS